MLSRLIALAVIAGAVFAAGCSLASDDEPKADAKRSRTSANSAGTPRNAVLYTIGYSTDPYGNSAPGGFGVATGGDSERLRTRERRTTNLGWFRGADWLDHGRIVVPQKAPPIRRPLIFRFDGRALTPAGASPLPVRHVGFAWSPNGRRIASQAVAPCKAKQRSLWSCYRQLPAIYVQRADGSGRRQVATGSFNAWAPDGRLLVTDRNAARYWLLDVDSHRRTPALDTAALRRFGAPRRLGLGAPRWSADRKYLAAYAPADWPNPTRGPKPSATIVIATAAGRPLQLIHSPYVISMFAWSPRGHRLAYTTSGFPDPHELFVVDAPTAKPRRIFATAHRHFDWVAWSPDATKVLLDDEHAPRWRLFRAHDGVELPTLPRLGGKPLWCCPVNSYTTVNG